MTSLESVSEPQEDSSRFTLLRRIGGVSLLISSCVGVAANVYVATEDLSLIPRIITSLAIGLVPLGGLVEKKVPSTHSR